jgi:putative nucleotidyltransferase with HDIG domain
MKKRLQILLPFVVATVAIITVMPKEGKFRYNFQKGKEWKYQTLVAEFDFPLYKSNAEIASEKRALLDSFLPYYEKDTGIAKQQTAKFATAFSDWLKDEKMAWTTKNHLQKTLLPQIMNNLQQVYYKGIRNNNRIAASYLDSSQSVVYVVTEHFAQATPIRETFLPDEAVRFIRNQIEQLVVLSDAEKDFVQKIPLDNYVVPNLLYNNQLTLAAQNEKLKLISPTSGMVVEGERIISQGEIVSNVKYQELDSYRKEYELRFGFGGNIWLLLLGYVLIVSLFIGALYAYLFLFHRDRLNFKNSSFLLLLILLFFALSRWAIANNFANIYVIPFAILAIYVCTFLGHRLAIVVQIIAVLLVATIVPDTYEFILQNTLVGFVAIFYAKKSYQRSSLYMGAVLIFTTYCTLYITQLLLNDGNFANFSPPVLLYFALNAGLVIASYQLIFVFEKVFGYISNTTLMEMSDTNQPLLRLLAEKAPATFQHSVQVANLAETAITKIDGNPLLVRAGALYHDLGKMQNPAYFIENQGAGYNPHTSILPEESAQIIIAHVSDGVAIARKHRLPQPIIDFILTHHGTSKTRYFYSRYKEKHPAGGDAASFPYPGNNPTTNEQAVLMLADVVEAASRTLTSYTNESIDALVESTVKTVLNDNVLNKSPLTFADISIVKASFKKKLQNVYHSRMIDNKQEP